MKNWRLRGDPTTPLVLLSAAMLMTSEVYGQASAPSTTPQSQSEIAEIVVTAQRRAESIQEVPISVTAVEPERLEDLNLRSVDAVAVVTPGFVFNTAYNFTQAFIRGIGSSFPQPGLEGSVATYVNGAYLPRGIGAIFDLLDVQSVQVLKGPQGTLWGRNATGGAIIVNTAEPTERTEGYALAEYGRFDRVMGEGVFNAPINDTVSLRFAGRYTREDGYIDNTTLDNEEPWSKSHTVRVSGAWRPTSDLSAVLTLEHSRATSEPFPKSERVDAPLCLGCTITGESAVSGFYKAHNELTGPNTLTKSFGANLRIRYTTGMYNIESVTRYLDLTNKSVNDLDATSANLFTVGPVELGGRTYSQDLVVSTDSGTWLDGVVGISAVQDNAFQESNYNGLALAALPGDPRSVNWVDTTSLSGFAEVTAKATEDLKVTLGGRYSHDKRKMDVRANQSAILGFGGIPGLFAFKQDFSFDAFTPRVVVAYQLNNTNLYASYNKGFKAGGISVPIVAPGEPVDPEKIDSYEIGAKWRSDGGRMYVNSAVFYYKHKDLQVRVVDLSSGGGVSRNAAASTGRGVELEFGYSPADGVQLYGGGSYLKAEFENFEGASVNSVVNGAFIPTFEDLSDTRLNNAPKWTGFLGGSFKHAIGSAWLMGLNTVVHYSSSYDFFPGAGGNLRLDTQDSYALTNISGYVGPQDERYQIGFYVNNATDKQYVVNRQTSAPFGVADEVARPRTYGVRVKYNF